MDTPNAAIGRQVREFREFRGISQRKFAEAASIDNSTLSRLEGGREITLSTFMRLVRHHGIPISFK